MDLALIGTIASAAAAALAWVAKLRWSREYAAAKDETIRAKEAQIEGLRQQVAALQDLTPMKLREYFLSTKTQLEEYIDNLKAERAETESKLARVTASLEAARIGPTTEATAGEVQTLDSERRALSTYLTHLRNRMMHASGAAKSWDDPAFSHAVTSLFEALQSTGKTSVTIAEDDDGTIEVDWAEPPTTK
jgi:chromosome segregation ATPase